jgi:hypothetical protein
MDSTIYSEILVLLDVLIGYVLRDHLVGHICPNCSRSTLWPTGVAPRTVSSNAEILPADDAPSSLSTTATAD